MTSATTLVELGERYVALGLPAAARGVLSRARNADDEAALVAARRLAELALAAGEVDEARRHAAWVAERDRGASARVLLGRAHLAAGEHAAARRALATALESAPASSPVRARAHRGLATAALAAGDRPGAAANAMAGIDELTAWAGADERTDDDLERELPLVDDLFGLAIALDRAVDADGRIDELAERRPERPWRLWKAALSVARQAHGDADVRDADIDALLDAQIERRPLRSARLRRVERRLRRRFRDSGARADAVAELEALADELSAGDASVSGNLDLARVHFLMAAACEDEPASSSRAVEAYREGLALRPGHAAAVERLAGLALARGDLERALEEIETALRIEPGRGPAWRHAARVVEASGHGGGMSAIVERVLDAAEPGSGTAAGAVAAHLITATVEVARSDVLAGMYARGHRMKNVLGIIASRARSARKRADGALAERLHGVERELASLYEEWANYLRSMQAAGPVIEVVPVAPLISEVVEAAAERSSAAIHSSAPAGLPDLRGDRMLLKEALLNVVSNAAEAAIGAAEVTVRQVEGAIIQIDVVDDGPGISRGDLARVFAPGFTTKESGSGVGLAIAERVVVAHHGRIELDSEQGRGTRVTVALPIDLGGFAGLAAFPSDPVGEGA